MSRTAASIAILAVWASPVRLDALQHPDVPSDHSAITEFIATARAGTERYRNRAAAVADGYRLIGREFPAMGEHWIHPHLVVRDTIDPARPQALAYATVDGEPVLVGVAYTSTGRPAHGPLAGITHWHCHSRSILQESLAPMSGRCMDGNEPGGGVAMVHAWIWLDNPDGMFARDNWALPFARLGLHVVPPIPRGAAQAISLLAKGDAFYRAAISEVGAVNDTEAAAVDGIIVKARNRVSLQLASRTDASAVTREQLAHLEAVWRAMWADVEGAVRSPVWDRLTPIRSDLPPSH